MSVIFQCLFTFFKSLTCLALQTETILKKITQPKSPKTKNELTKICNEPGISENELRNEIEIENASMKDFLMDLVKNLGRGEISTTSLIAKKMFQAWRTVTNFNLPGKSRKNVEHHYDIGGARGEKLYDIFLDKTHRLYSCAYWKENTKTLEEAQQNKIDHIVKKLDIQEGQKILEIGVEGDTIVDFQTGDMSIEEIMEMYNTDSKE